MTQCLSELVSEWHVAYYSWIVTAKNEEGKLKRKIKKNTHPCRSSNNVSFLQIQCLNGLLIATASCADNIINLI